MEKEKFIEIVKNCTSKSEVCRELGWDSKNSNDKRKVNNLLTTNQVDISHFSYGRLSYNIKELKEAVENSLSYSEVCRTLGLKPNGGNFSSIKKIIKINSINIDHFIGQSWNTGERFINNGVKYDLETVMVENSTYSRFHLKRRLISEGILDYKCVKCGNEGEWMGKSITLQLDHINGVNDDNRLENLRFLCPNCHSQTDTHSGKNNR
jgi:hypothetical protein